MRIKIIAFLTSLTLFGCASSISTGELNFPTKENKISYEKVNQTKLPFIANNGQLDTKVKFYARTFAGTVYVTDNELVYDLPKLEKDKTVSKQGVSFKETFVNTDLERLNPQAGKQSNATYSSFIGKDKSKWTSGNTTYQSVSIGEPWEGIKLELFAHGNNVEKIFTVMPGIEPSKISLAFEGTEDFKIDNQTGEMIVKTDLGEVKFTKPIAYQMSKGEKIPVQVSYHIEHNKYGFTVGDYDHSRELIIDPLLGSTYLGGSNTDYLLGIAVDSSGNAYVTGYTISSSDFPTTSGAYDRTYNTNTDTFVSKLSSDLTTLVASTFIGGTSGDYASRIAIDTTDNVYIAGNTNSSDYPVTSGAYSETATASSGFISKFNSSLTTLLASTFIPSDTSINLNQLTVDAAGDVFVVGSTNSSNYPTTTGVYDRTANGGQDAYISKFNSSLTTLIASTLIGGASTDNGSGIAFDSTGNIYLLGFTNGSDYPTTSDGYDISHNGDNDVFISKFNSTLTSLLKSTFLGGSAAEVNGKISIDSSDSVFVVSSTDSSDFPTTAGAYDRSHNGSSDIAISKLNSSLTTLAASTFIGTTADDIAYSMALDLSGNVYSVARTGNGSYPVTSGSYDESYNSAGDIAISKFNSSLTTLVASTFIGGSLSEDPYGFVLDNKGHFYVAGFTLSADFVTTTGAYAESDPSGAFIENGFISKGYTTLSTTAASVNVINVTSSTANGTYKAGGTVSIQVVFDSIVTVTGTPRLTLETGSTDAVVNYSSGSGTNILTFTYTVSSDNNSADLDYASTSALALNSGTITDSEGNSAILTLASPGAAGSLANNKAIVIDTVTTGATLNSPVAGSGNIFTVAYTLGETPSTVSLLFIDSMNSTAATINLNGATSNTFGLNSKNITVTAPITASTLSTIPDGTYTLRLSYQDAVGNAASTTSVSGITVDSVTQSPTLSAPTTGSYGQNFQISYSLPEIPATNSVHLLFIDGSSTTVANLTLNSSSSNNFTENLRNIGVANPTIVTSSTASSIPDGTYTVTLSYQDFLSNPVISSSVSNVIIDTVRPTVAITSTTSSITNTAPIPITITFSETVTGFISSDITVSNGSLSDFSGSGTTYTANVNPTTNGSVTVDVNSGVAQDAAGNTNTAATQLTRTYDSVAPSVSITSSASDPSDDSPIPVTVTFSESVTAFVAGDITVDNGSVGNFAGSGTTYTADITPSANGTVTVDVAAGVAQDVTGNNNSTGTFTITYDYTNPTPAITTAAGFRSLPLASVTGTVEAEKTVEVFSDSLSLGTTTADNEGNWTLSLSPALSGGTYSLTAISSGEGQNDSPASAAISVTIPSMPLDFDKDGISDTAMITSGKKSGSVKIVYPGDTKEFTVVKPKILSAFGDYDGNGDADIAVISKGKKNIEWTFIDKDSSTQTTESFGSNKSTILIGCNFDSTYETEMASYLGSNLSFKHKGGGVTTKAFGKLYPIANLRGCGDVDGDGIAELIFNTTRTTKVGKKKVKSIDLDVVKLNGQLLKTISKVGKFTLAYVGDVISDETNDIAVQKAVASPTFYIYEGDTNLNTGDFSVSTAGSYAFGVNKNSDTNIYYYAVNSGNPGSNVSTKLLKTGTSSTSSTNLGGNKLVNSYYLYTKIK